MVAPLGAEDIAWLSDVMSIVGDLDGVSQDGRLGSRVLAVVSAGEAMTLNPAGQQRHDEDRRDPILMTAAASARLSRPTPVTP